jgi:hypothetical protein
MEKFFTLVSGVGDGGVHGRWWGRREMRREMEMLGEMEMLREMEMGRQMEMGR